MKTSILMSAAFAAVAQSAASTGCGNLLSPQLTRGGSSQTNTLNFTTSGGVIRSYLLHIPSSYDINTPAPIAFSYHGRTESPQDQENISGMSNETFNPNYLVVYPQGINLQWQGDPAAVGYDDVGFTLELLANLSSTFCIDSSRVYAAGKSNGGGFAANVLACDTQASRLFAAFAGASGAYYQGTTDANCNDATVSIACNPGRYPVPIFTTHGDADTTIPYTGGGRRGRCLPSIPLFMTSWSTRNGLGSSNTSVSLYNNNVVRYDYGNDSFSQLSAHYYVHGLGHTWPSIAAGSSFDATPLLIAFWNKWTLDTTPYNFVNATPSVTTTSSSTQVSSTAISSSSVSSANMCPSANGQSVTDSSGNTYKVTCSADNSVGSYANTQASASYLDCMTACDAASTAGCVGFTYVGGTNGVGSGLGTCWLKKSMGTYPASGSNTISAVRISGGSPGNSVSSAAQSTSSTSSTSSSVSLSTAPTTSALSCPASNNQLYTYAANGAQFVIECGIDHSGGDMASTSVKNLEGCIAACATTNGCVDVSLSGAACYLKKTLGAAVNNGGILGARFIGTVSTVSSSSLTSPSTSSTLSTSSTSSSPSSISSSSLAMSTSTTVPNSSSFVSSSSTGPAATPGSSSSSSPSSSLSTIVLPSVGTDGYTTTSYPPTCTAINTNIYAVTDSSGKPYLYMCGGGSAGGTASTITNVANWTACFQACDGYNGCTGFSYNQGAAFGNGVGQCLIKTDSPQSFVSTANLLSTRIAGYIRPITITSSSVATSASASATASTSSTVVLSSSSILSPSTIPSMTSFSTSTISSTSVASSSLIISSSSSSISSSFSSSIISSSSSSSISSSSSVLSTAVAPSSTPIAAPSCPASNGTTYTDAGGLQYTILCTYDTSANVITTSPSIGSFGDCTVLCDNITGCTGLTWNGTVCSLKQSFGQYILGAVKV
ncbi:alpha/beta-hydrolase [Aureobasidium sp. EXF-10727]|nr:alpha/beta-hydrolase [Aureobasidium sp. EXF-10727]